MKGENEELLTRQLAINDTNFSMPVLDCPLNPIRKIGNIGKIDENRLNLSTDIFGPETVFFFSVIRLFIEDQKQVKTTHFQAVYGQI